MSLFDSGACRRNLALLVGALLSVGCGDAESGTAGGGMPPMSGAGGEGGGGTGGSDIPPPPRVEFLISINEYAPILEDGTISLEHPGATPSALEGVLVCELDTDNCQTTNAQGKVVLEVPADATLAVSAQKDGYRPELLIDFTDDTFSGDRVTGLLSDAQATLLAEQLGVAYPLEGGMAGLVRLTGPQAGVSFELVDANSALGPYYFDTDAQRYNADLTDTRPLFRDYDLPAGNTTFAEIPSGVYEVELGGDAGVCVNPSKGWPSQTPNRVQFPVRDGFYTYVSINCE